VLTLATGCLCCAVQTDLARTLLDLRDRFGEAFDRVVIETSGLGDPGPMLQAMMADAAVASAYAAPSVVTLVDPVFGLETLHQHPEAQRQVALADAILFSKPDVRQPADDLLAAVAALNAAAPRGTTRVANSADLFAAGSLPALLARLAAAPPAGRGHAAINSFTLERDRPVPALALTLLLQALAEHCGARLLRLKGLVDIAEMPGRPAVIHAVRHVAAAPEFLDRWPDADTRTRIVFITQGVPRYFPARLLDAIETEVLDTSAHLH
jgi:G3E family GTPase